MRIGATTIPDPPADFEEMLAWMDEVLIPAGFEMVSDPRCQRMGFDGRPLSSMEMLAGSWAIRTSPIKVAERWIEDFETFLQAERQDSDSTS